MKFIGYLIVFGLLLVAFAAGWLIVENFIKSFY